jgi:C4-dicarboxylate transporter DctQ subunit
MDVVRKIDRALAAVEYACIGGLTLLALALGTMQVVLRYAFNTGFDWSAEAFTLTTIAAMLVAGSRAVREDKHVRVELAALMTSHKVGRVLRLLAHLATLLLCAYFAWCGVLYVQFTKMIGSVSPDSGTPDYVIYSLVPLTMGMFVIRYVIRIILVLRDEDVESVHGLSDEIETARRSAP